MRCSGVSKWGELTRAGLQPPDSYRMRRTLPGRRGTLAAKRKRLEVCECWMCSGESKGMAAVVSCGEGLSGGCWLHMRGPWGALQTLPAQAAPITPDSLELMFKALQVIALGLESLGGGTIFGGRREVAGGWGRGTRQGLTCEGFGHNPRCCCLSLNVPEGRALLQSLSLLEAGM